MKISYLPLICFILLALNINNSHAQQANFTNLVVSSGWTDVVGFVWDSTGQQYVWEKAGKVWVVDTNGVKNPTAVINISDEVGSWRDHGLNGFALDPNFRNNGYIYLYYTVDRYHLINSTAGNYNPATNQYYQATIARVTRYTCDPATNFTTIIPGSRFILIGETKKTGIAVLHESHSGGTLLFGTDGSLLVSTGDGASYNFVDGGGGATYWSQALADSIIRPKENVGSFRSQMVDCLNGKILRIDPATGDGLESNPYFDPSNARAPQSRVWSLGLRNPFRVTFRPGTGDPDITAGNPGTLYIGDVGWDNWEDLNVNNAPGQNFGWPLYEGLTPHTGYQNANVYNQDAPNPLFGTGGCTNPYFQFKQLLKQATLDPDPFFSNPCDAAQEVPSSIPTFIHNRPIIDWKHGNQSRTGIYDGIDADEINLNDPASPVPGSSFGGYASIAGVWYDDNRFPVEWQNTYFHGDYVGQWIRNFKIDTLDKPLEVDGFWDNNGVIVYMTLNRKNGCISYINYPDQIKEICYGGTVNNLPTAVLSSDTMYGAGPLAVQFTGSNSIDPENLTLTYLWNFGDGTTSTLADPQHVYTPGTSSPQSYFATLTVTDNLGQTDKDSIFISVNNTPPQVQIISFNDGDFYSMSGFTNLPLEALVTDAEHSSGELFYEWRTILHHNIHTHIEEIDTNKITTSVISPVGCEAISTYYFRINLKVTDAAGLSTTVNANIYPQCDPPVSAISASDSTICKGSTVQFNDLSTQFPVQWEWEFEGGTPTVSTDQNPIVTYANAGIFDVKLITSSFRGSDTLLLTDFMRVYQLPNIFIAGSNGTNEFCDGTPYDLIANSTSSIVSWNWTRNSSPIGSNQSSIALTKAGNYRVTVTDNRGCSKMTPKFVVTKNALPLVTLTQSGPLTFCPGDSVVLTVTPQTGNTYQWKRYSNFITGATNNSYSATTSGIYKVIVTGPLSCVRVSKSRVVNVTCPEIVLSPNSEFTSKSLKISPNPANEVVQVSFSKKSSGVTNLYLMDITGKNLSLIENAELESGYHEVEVNLEGLSSGVYQLVLIENGETSTVKLVIANK